MSKMICPECGQQVKLDYWTQEEFSENDPIICIEKRGKHFLSYIHLEEWLRDKFEEDNTVVQTYVERVA